MRIQTVLSRKFLKSQWVLPEPRLPEPEQRDHRFIESDTLNTRFPDEPEYLNYTWCIASGDSLTPLGTLNRQQIARLVGVAPTNRDSGTLRGKRTTGGGRVDVRNALFMPTVVAKQFNPTIKTFYNRLVESGKAKMTAIIAAMRKLLTILNTMIKNQTLWNPPKTP